MPAPGTPLEKLGFLTIGLFDANDPRPGHETTLDVIALGEQLGFDSAFVRHRHLQYGISSPIAVLAAATQRTHRIELGTAVIPLGWENPLRLAEDLATVDILSGGRLNAGVSVGPPMHWDDVKQSLYPDTADIEDFSYERVERLLRFIRGEQAGTFRGTEGIEEWSDRVEPHSPGLQHRLWYGGGSTRSAQWAGAHGMNFLTSNVVKAEDSTDFAEIQAGHIRAFREAAPESARVSQGLVVIPTDSATAEQRAKYAAYVEARSARTASRRAPASCSSPRTWWAPPSRSPRPCTRTPASARSARSSSRCRSASSTRTTCSCSPTSPPTSARRSAGGPPVIRSRMS